MIPGHISNNKSVQRALFYFFFLGAAFFFAGVSSFAFLGLAEAVVSFLVAAFFFAAAGLAEVFSADGCSFAAFFFASFLTGFSSTSSTSWM